MNEKIKTLALSSGLVSEYKNRLECAYMEGSDLSDDIQTFAELIIQECVNVIKNSDAECLDEWGYVERDLAGLIQKHFGIMSDTNLWVDYPDTQPTEHGYYMTYYFNLYHQQHLYKAIYWDNGWIPWRRDGSPDLSRVLGFVPCTRAAYYTKCMGIFEREVRQNYKTEIDNEKFP